MRSHPWQTVPAPVHAWDERRPVKPGYKQTDVGVIPEEWEVAQIRDLKPFVTSGSRGWAAFYSERGSLFVRITNMSRNSIYLDLEKSKFVSLPAESSEGIRTQLQEHDLLISITADIGIVSYVDCRVPTPAFINQHISLVRFDQAKTSGKFVSYFLASEKPQALFRASTDVGAKAGMSLPTVQKLEVALPPLPEQRAIAEALSDVDALLGALDRLIAKKRDLKQAAMQQLLTGQTRLPGFHGEWEVKRLGDLFNFSGGYSASRDQLSTEGHCYLHYGDIHGSSKTCIDADADFQDIPKLAIPLKRVSSASLLDDGDVVFVDASEDDAGTSKHIVVVNKGKKPFISGLHTIVAKSKTDELAHDYRRYCFQTPAIRQQFLFYSVGTKVSGISKSNIPKLTLSFPSVPEQIAIAGALGEMDAELVGFDQWREKTRALKQAMMQELLTGKTRLVEPQRVDA
jgi:type I restriction enzyme S subunit